MLHGANHHKKETVIEMGHRTRRGNKTAEVDAEKLTGECTRQKRPHGGSSPAVGLGERAMSHGIYDRRQ